MESLISLDDFTSHLRLLGAIWSFFEVLSKDHVRFDVNTGFPSATLAGKVFLGRSVHRLKLWIIFVLRPKYTAGRDCTLQPFELPPFDVLMMLHAYMLHPHRFYEDTLRLHPELAVIKGFPLQQVAALIDDSMHYVASDSQISFWETSTKECFSPPLHTTAEDRFSVTCPRCQHAFWAPWVSESPFDADFKSTCNQCGLIVTNEILGVSSFFDDIRRSTANGGFGIAGTLLTDEGVSDANRSKDITALIASIIRIEDLENQSLPDIVHMLKQPATSTIMEASVDFFAYYGHMGGFSLDIASAVLRQGRFASMMYQIGWTKPGLFQKSARNLQSVISRYHLYLELVIRTGSIQQLSPSPEIDFVWHTHQLRGPSYRDDLLRLFGVVLDHADDENLAVYTKAYSDADLIWKEKYGTPYADFLKNSSVTVDMVDGTCVNCGGRGCSQCQGGGACGGITRSLKAARLLTACHG